MSGTHNLCCGNGKQLQAQKEEILNLTQTRSKRDFSSLCRETQRRLKRLKSDFLSPKNTIESLLRVKMSLFSHFWSLLSLVAKGKEFLELAACVGANLRSVGTTPMTRKRLSEERQFPELSREFRGILRAAL